jgi:hypothetical protein
LSDKLTIKDLNKLILISDKLSEIHVKNLQEYPFIFFNDVEEVKIEHDISIKIKNSSFVHYYLTLSKENDNIKIRFEHLEKSIKALFWKEVQVKLYINDKEYKNE